MCIRDRFNSLTRDTSETFQQFATRLMSLFDLHLESRKIGNSYEKLFDLIIYDRIKSVLPSFLSRHIFDIRIGGRKSLDWTTCVG